MNIKDPQPISIFAAETRNAGCPVLLERSSFVMKMGHQSKLFHLRGDPNHWSPTGTSWLIPPSECRLSFTTLPSVGIFTCKERKTRCIFMTLNWRQIGAQPKALWNLTNTQWPTFIDVCGKTESALRELPYMQGRRFFSTSLLPLSLLGAPLREKLFLMSHCASSFPFSSFGLPWRLLGDPIQGFSCGPSFFSVKLSSASTKWLETNWPMWWRSLTKRLFLTLCW